MLNIRANTFETNSSSVHTICITDDEIYQQWVEGKLYYNNSAEYNDYPDFVTYEEAQELDSEFPYPESENWDAWNFQGKDGYWHEKVFVTFEQFFENYDWEHFDKKYVTNNGDVVRAFGYYGHD
jgi:hypothetical protein